MKVITEKGATIMGRSWETVLQLWFTDIEAETIDVPEVLPAVIDLGEIYFGNSADEFICIILAAVERHYNRTVHVQGDNLEDKCESILRYLEMEEIVEIVES